MKRIFYFNINYNCNNRCVFCYSHNTLHSSVPFRELSLTRFDEFLSQYGVSMEDRIILNGGEPLLHSQFDQYLDRLKLAGCETLIYTNGRQLKRIRLNALTDRFRFIVPIHGHETLHDSITGIPGSFRETLEGMQQFTPDIQCILDMKVILNPDMVQSDVEFSHTMDTLRDISFNGSLHITKMADTIVSKRNGYPSMDDETAALYTERLFDAYRFGNHPIKLYDTCVRHLMLPEQTHSVQAAEERVVYYCDCTQERLIPLRKTSCQHPCRNQMWCISAVEEYKVLEYYNGDFYQGLE